MVCFEKISYLVVMLMVIAGVAFGQAYYSVSGWDCEARVDTVNGHFGVGQLSTGHNLTYEFDNPSILTLNPSSNMVFRIDGETYGWLGVVLSPDHDLYDYNAPTYPRHLISSNIIQNRWLFPLPGGEVIQIDQYFAPANHIVTIPEDGDTIIDTLGLAKVSYRVLNNGTLPHSVGIEHKWDVKINLRDDAPVSIPGTYDSINTVYTPTVPGSFTAAEFDLLDPDLDQLIAMGIIGIDDCTPPNFLAYGSESELIPSRFTVTPAFAGGLYSYSGVLLRWDDRTVVGGNSFDIITYYGLGNIKANRGEIRLATTTTNWSADSCRLAGNPKEFTAIVRNQSTDLTTFDTLWLCINFDSSMASLVIDGSDIYADSLCYEYYDVVISESYTKTWLFEAYEDTCGTFEVYWTCSTSTPGIDAVFDTTISTVPCISGLGPEIDFIQPAYSFTACTTGSGLEVMIEFDKSYDPTGIEIDYTKTIVRIDAGDDSVIINFEMEEAFIWDLLPGDLTDTLKIPLDSLPMLIYGTGDEIIICVLNVVDNYGCKGPYICDTLVVDQSPPILWFQFPPPDSEIASSTPMIEIGLVDSVSGVDSMNIFYSVAGTHYSVSGFPGSYFNPTTDLVMHSVTSPFPCENWIEVCVDSVADLTDATCGPNWLYDTCWNFFVDCNPPTVELIRPTNLSIISCSTPVNVAFRVNDSTCVDSTVGIINFIPGPTIDFSAPGYPIDWYCDSFVINGITFPEGGIRVEVSGIRDGVGNEMIPVTYNFSVDTLGPLPDTLSISPPPGSFVSPIFACSLLVTDDSPLADTSIHWKFNVGGATHTYTIMDINTDIHSLGVNNWLLYSNALGGFTVSHGDTIHCCLTNCNDIAELCGQNTLVGDSVCWDYYVDAQGPSATLLWPANHSISACYPLWNLDILLDDASGVDPTSVVVSLEGVPFPIFDFGDTFRCFIGPMDDIPVCPESVMVELLQASDFLGNMTVDSLWWFILDTIPPFSEPLTWEPAPATPIPSVSPFDTIEFVESPGCEGWFSRSNTLVNLFVRPAGIVDSIWGDDTRVIWEGDTWNLPIQHLDYISDSDTICIKLAHFEDSLEYMSIEGCEPAFDDDMTDYDDWCIRISAGGPMINLRYPQRSYISCLEPPNGFQYRIFDDDGLNVSTIRFYVYTPDGDTTEFTWADLPYDTTWLLYPDEMLLNFYLDVEDYAAVGESLCVEFNRIQDMFDVYNEGVSKFCIVVDTTDPCPEDYYPNEMEIDTRTPLIWAYVPHDFAPINTDSLAFSMNGGTDWIWSTDSSGAVYWGIGDTAFLDVSMLDTSLWISGGDTVEICVRNTDQTDTLVGCPINHCETCWSFWLAANGPIPSAIVPGEDWIWACPQVDSMVIALVDSDGIDWSTIEVTCSSYVTGTSNHYIWPSGNLRSHPETLVVIPDTPYSTEDTIGVTVWAYDNLMNFVSSGPYEYQFIIDQTPPDLIWTTPSCEGDSVSDNTPIIWFNANDRWGRVDTLSWCIGFLHPGSTTDWDTVCYEDEPGAWLFTGSTDSVGLNTGLVTILSPWWLGGDTIVYSVINVCDETDTCGPNCTSSTDTCHLRIASRGPEIKNLWPDGNGILGCEQPDTFVFEIFDIDEINTSSLSLWYSSCSTDSVAFGIGDVAQIVDYIDGPEADTLYFVPPEVLAEGCYFNIGIEVLDMIGNTQEPNSFDFVYDYTPPSFVIDHPYDLAYSFTPDVYMVFPDNIAGIDTNTVTVSITSGPCAPVSAVSPAPDTLEWRFSSGVPETLILSFDALGCILYTGDSACIHVDMSCDNSAACPACTTYDTTWCFEVVQGGPTPELVYPMDLLCPEDSIVFQFTDIDSVLVDGMKFAVNGTEVPYPGTAFVWDPALFVLTYNPSASFDTSYIEVCIDSIVDGLGYGMPLTCWDIRVDLDPPIPEYISPVGIIGDHQPDIILTMLDSLNFVNPDCFVLTVNGETFNFDGTILSWIPETTIATPGTLVWSAVLAGDTLDPGPVDVCLVEACDSTGCFANNMLSSLGTTFCWDFEVAVGDGPVVTLEQPSDCGLGISCTTTFQFRWSIVDVEGVASHSFVVKYMERGILHTFNIDSSQVTLIDGDSTLLFEPLAPEAAGSVWVRVEDMTDVLGNPSWGFDDTCWFVIDWDAPYVIDYSPDDMSELATPYPLIWFYVTDSSYIIDYSTGVIRIAGTAYDLSDPHVYWNGDTIFFDPRIDPPMPFGGGDSIVFCLESLADSTIICEPNVIATECYTFFINSEGPNVSVIFPDTTLDPMITFCDSGAFWLRTVDPEGLDTLSVVVIWNGDTTRWVDMPGLFDLYEGTSSVDTVALWPPFSVSDGDTMCLELVQWTDSIGNNFFGDLTLCAISDQSPPDTDWVLPNIGEVTNTWSPDIFASLIDQYSWIDHDIVGIRINENGNPWGSFPWPSTELAWAGDTIVFSTDSDFTEFAEICVYVSISDSSTIETPYNCAPNGTSIEWCFNIGDDDTVGPVVVIPDSCYVRANYDQFQIVIGVTDPDGIFDDASIDTLGQGLLAEFFTSTTTYWLPMEIDSVIEYAGPEGDSIYWISTTPGAIPDSDIISGMFFGYIIWSHDNDFDFDNLIDRQLAVSDTHWCVIYNDIPPEITVNIAPDQSWVSCLCPNQSIELEFADIDSLKSSLIILEVNGVEYSITSPQITWDPGYSGHHFGVHYLTYMPDSADCWEHGDTVQTSIRNIVDQWGNEAENYFWEFYMDFFPPVAWCFAENDTNVDITDLDSIVFHLDDENAGVNPYEIVLQVTQVVGAETHVILYDIETEGALSYDGTAGNLVLDLEHATGLDLSRDDTLFFTLAHTEDLTTICDPNVLDDYYMCVKYIKPITRCHASPQPFTPPPPADGYNDEVVFDYPGRIDIDGIVKVYDMRGRQVAEITASGSHRFAWDGYDFNGVPVRPGVYVYVIEQGGEVICSGTVVLAR
ncbi:hypothetical protein KAH81_00965 [bacterium]|nr:hypothetical protein [bacterium]